MKGLETLINSELAKGKKWCDVNKLSINLSKTNYMIIKSSRKTSENIEIKLQSMDGSWHLLKEKDHIKYLGVMIDESIVEISYLLYLFPRFTKHWHYFKTKTLSIYSSTETNLL